MAALRWNDEEHSEQLQDRKMRDSSDRQLESRGYIVRVCQKCPGIAIFLSYKDAFSVKII